MPLNQTTWILQDSIDNSNSVTNHNWDETNGVTQLTRVYTQSYITNSADDQTGGHQNTVSGFLSAINMLSNYTLEYLEITTATQIHTTTVKIF